MKRTVDTWMAAIVMIAAFFFVYQDITKKPSLQISETSFNMGSFPLGKTGQ